MSLRLRRIALDRFRKFRQPIVIDGLTDGLNIIIEANETGKSTLLEALRAAFFVRHNTRNQLAQSYAPHGEAVGPEIQVDFEMEGVPWSVTKRFLKSPTIEVAGPQGRAQGEDAETRLNTLLGSVRDTSRGGDISTYGALGLLWVAQTEALEVTAPGQIVRDTVAATLEAEVGSIMGGPAYKRVRDRVDEQFGGYWTPTGQKRGRQNEARERLEAAEIAARDAAARLAALESTFTELEAARARLKIIERDIADPTDAEARAGLVASLDTARAAAQILVTRRAEQESASGKVNGLEDLQRRHKLAVDAQELADRTLAGIRERRSAITKALGEARQKAGDARAALDLARKARQDARTALTTGEQHMRAARRQAAITAARDRHRDLLALEQQHREAKAAANLLIPAKRMSALEAEERVVAEARAALRAGATQLAFTGPTAGITIDGEPIAVGERTLARATILRLGEAELVITPPASVENAERSLTSALATHRASLTELGIADLAAARSRNEAARDAAADVKMLATRIAAATPADAAIDLAAGADALKLFVTEQVDAGAAPDGTLPDMKALATALDEAEAALSRAEGTHDSALEALRRAQEEDAPLAAAEAGAASDQHNAAGQRKAIEDRAEFASLEKELASARERAAETAVALEDAKRNATAHDPAAISRRIESIDARARTASETRNRLVTEIARLENTVEIEGGAGLADRAAATAEEADAARAALDRITLDAETLKLLRDTLEEARGETSAKFVGPVARRAKRYIERLLPDCELRFSDDLALLSVARADVPEDCASLSKGTQEQLAILTRIAFADMLLEQGKPVSLILDDPLVYSDDTRLDLMIDILSETATRMQVVLLTCRDRAFRHVDGHRIMLGS